MYPTKLLIPPSLVKTAKKLLEEQGAYTWDTYSATFEVEVEKEPLQAPSVDSVVDELVKKLQEDKNPPKPKSNKFTQKDYEKYILGLPYQPNPSWRGKNLKKAR